jgi:hypothetical protein
MTTKPMAEIRAEFDRIALTSGADEAWNYNNHYGDYPLIARI